MPRWLILFPVLLSSARAQPRPSFDLASVKAVATCCAPGQTRVDFPVPKAGEDRIDFRYVTLRYCIEFAFRVEDYQISGPPWLADAHFEIEAKGPDGTRHAQLPDMMQALLRERFGLKIHRETKDLSALVLVVTKGGPKLQEAPNAKDDADATFGMSMSYEGVGKMEVKRATMATFAKTLSRFMHRPVVDLTGLNGRYDFDVNFSSEDSSGLALITVNGERPESDSVVSIYTSIQKLGLKLEARKAPLDVIVVDEVYRTPTEN